MTIKDIPENEWNILREDYKDELLCMNEIDEDEYYVMLENSERRNEHSDIS